MIKEHTKLSIPDVDKNNDIEIEVNYNNYVSENGLARVTVGDKKVIIKLEDLYMVTLSLSKPEQMDNLLPVKQMKMTKLFRQHQIMAMKDIKKGEKIIANCEIEVPMSTAYTLSGNVKGKIIH